MLNQCILTGNLGDDPSSHYTPEGLAITHFNIAFKSSAKKKDANWIKVSCFGKLAEVPTIDLTQYSFYSIVPQLAI
jgi:single-strand DNA-binding protein